MNAFIIVNGQQVKEVQPNQAMQLNVQSVPYWPPKGSLRFRVVSFVDLSLPAVLEQYVSINAAANGWLDWTAPSIPGAYRFYPDADDPSIYVDFMVSGDAFTPKPIPDWTDKILPGLGEVKWIVIAVAAIALFVLIFLYIPRR